MNHNDNIKLTDVQLYKEDNGYFLSLKYHGENLEREYEIEIPKVALQIRQDDILINSVLTANPYTTEMDKFEEIRFYGGNSFQILDCADGYRYKETTIKEKKRKMTVAEIEKALGYKVEIVNKK